MKDQFELLHMRYKALTKAILDIPSMLSEIAEICVDALNIISNLESKFQGSILDKEYIVFYRGKGESKQYSRPVLKSLFIGNSVQYRNMWQEMLSSINRKKCIIEHRGVGALIYTTSQAFSCAYDLFKPSSRKTPGTYFEMLMSTLLVVTTQMPIGKQINIPNEKFKIPTDIVLYSTERQHSSLVIPTKITTRERVVQPWAHHRIVNDVFGEGIYKTILVCVSELQRDGEKGVNEICVPNQVGLFQRHLAELSGMYYADPPYAYTKANFKNLPVRSLGQLFNEDLPILVGLQEKL